MPLPCSRERWVKQIAKLQHIVGIRGRALSLFPPSSHPRCLTFLHLYGIIGFLLPLLTLDTPREVSDRNEEETANENVSSKLKMSDRWDSKRSTNTNLLESSNIPASALYHARNAESSPKNPPALMTGGFGIPLASGFR